MFIYKWQYVIIISYKQVSLFSAWFTDDESDVVARVNKRIAEIAGLDMKTAETLQASSFFSFMFCAWFDIGWLAFPKNVYNAKYCITS